MPSQPAQGVPSVVMRVLLLQNHPETGQKLSRKLFWGKSAGGKCKGWCRQRGWCWIPSEGWWRLRGKPLPWGFGPHNSTFIALFVLSYIQHSREATQQQKVQGLWGGRPSFYSHFETPPFLPWLGHPRDTASRTQHPRTQHPRTQPFCTPLAVLQAWLLALSGGDPRSCSMGTSGGMQ